MTQIAGMQVSNSMK